MTAFNIDPIESTDTATADLFNERFAAVAQVLNKGIDADNIKDGAITAALLASDMLNKQYPVGSIYMNASVNTNPATLLGFGVWTAFGAGRVPVGFDGSQTEFNAVGKTGGHKEMQAHSHTYTTPLLTGDTDRGGNSSLFSLDNTGTYSSSTTGGGDSGNLQPYIVVYMWVRAS